MSSLGSDDALELFSSRDRESRQALPRSDALPARDRRRALSRRPWTAKLALSGHRARVDGSSAASTSTSCRARRRSPRAASPRHGARRPRVQGPVVARGRRDRADAPRPRRRDAGAARRGRAARTVDDPIDTSLRYMGTIPSLNHAAWTAATASLDDRIRLTGGMRVDRYGRTRDALVQPRGELQISSAEVVARALRRRLQPAARVRAELLAPLRAERSRQIIAGVRSSRSRPRRAGLALLHRSRRPDRARHDDRRAR